MKASDQFRKLAAYNRWANARLYAAALELSDKSCRLYIGVFSGSLYGTLNHLLLTDRLWLKRLTGEGEYPDQLDAILYEDRAKLTRARIAEDNRRLAVIDRYDDAALPRSIRTKLRRECRSPRSCPIFSFTFSIIKLNIGDRPTPSYQS